MGSASQSRGACWEGQASCALTCKVNGPLSWHDPCLLEKWVVDKLQVQDGSVVDENKCPFMASDHVCAFEQKLGFYKTYRHTSRTASHYLNFFAEISGNITVSF